jgi:hypothetical protein
MTVNNFGPFNAEVWGTVSDWVIVILTFLTAVYLIRTFQGQKELFILQNNTNQLEHFKFKTTIRPHFHIGIENSTDIVSKWKTEPFKVKLKGTITNHQGAKNITIESKTNDDKWILDKSHIHEITSFEPIHSIAFIYSYKGIISFPNGNLIINIKYEDLAGGVYTQQFMFTTFKGIPDVSQGQPIEILSKK